MATSKITCNEINCIAWDNFSEVDWALFSIGNIAILSANIHSGSDGISQYHSVIYGAIPSAVRPSSYGIPCVAYADNKQIYGFQVLSVGSLQATSNIPANLELTVFCTWKF